MALIAAVIGSLLGAVLGVISMVAFDMSFLGAFGVYMLVSLGFVFVSASALIAVPDSQSAAHGVFEDELDADWQEFEARTRRMSTDEAAFQADLDAPLTDSNRRKGEDRRKGSRRSV